MKGNRFGWTSLLHFRFVDGNNGREGGREGGRGVYVHSENQSVRKTSRK